MTKRKTKQGILSKTPADMLYFYERVRNMAKQFHMKGFTLVELLIIVAIIALLAAMTLPTYQLNSTKARIATVIPTLDLLMHDLLVKYNALGKPPTSLEGVSGTGGGGYGAYVVPNTTTNLHYDDGSTWRNTGALIGVTIPPIVGQAIPGFVESTNGSDGAFNSIVMAFYELNGTVILYCGRWDSSSNLYVPPDFLPPGCDNDNFKTIVSGL